MACRKTNCGARVVWYACVRLDAIRHGYSISNFDLIFDTVGGDVEVVTDEQTQRMVNGTLAMGWVRERSRRVQGGKRLLLPEAFTSRVMHSVTPLDRCMWLRRRGHYY